MTTLFALTSIALTLVISVLFSDLNELEKQLNNQSNIPASCYINTDKKMFCVNSKGKPVPVTLYKSYENTWDYYSRPEGWKPDE